MRDHKARLQTKESVIRSQTNRPNTFNLPKPNANHKDIQEGLGRGQRGTQAERAGFEVSAVSGKVLQLTSSWRTSGDVLRVGEQRLGPGQALLARVMARLSAWEFK